MGNYYQPPPQYPPPPPPGYGPPGYPYRPPGQYPGKGLCIASMVLGICSLCIPYAGLATAIVGLVLGIMGRNKAMEVGAPTGMATAGIVCSIVGLAGSVLILIYCITCFGACGGYGIPWYLL